MTEQEIEIHEAEHHPQLEKLYLELYGTCNDSQDDVEDERASKALSAAAMNDDVQLFVERGKIVNDIRPILEDIKDNNDLSNPADILAQNVEIPNDTSNNISLSREEIKAFATLFGYYISEGVKMK